MSRTLLLNRAVALHRPRPATLSLRPFSTSKPSKGDKGKRPKNFDSPGSSKSQSTKKKRGRPAGSKKGDGPPILIPPGRKQSFASLPNPPFDRSHSENEEPSFVHDTWTVNVSPFLDPPDFCKRSAFYEDTPTRNGTLAARRLLQGKEQVLEKLKENILENNKKQRKPRSYTIIGHGVPKQLLQDHVDMVDSLLKQHENAAEIEIGFKGSTAELSVKTLQVCNVLDGKKRERRLEPWPFEQYSEEDDQMQLYLTVMNRISTTLSDVLWRDAPVPVVVENEEEEDDDFVSSTASSTAAPLRWNVHLWRGTKTPNDSMLTPIVEWALPDSDSAPGCMAIRLRGQPTGAAPSNPTKSSKRRMRRPVDVSMVFHATFENPMKKQQ